MSSIRNYCLKPYVVVKESIRVPLMSVMSFDYHVHDLALKSPKITVNWDFEKRTLLLSMSSKPERKDSNSVLLWLGDLYVTAAYPFLFCIVTSQTRHSGKYVMSTKSTAKGSL